MPYRSLPRADLAHLDALATAQRRLDALLPGESSPLRTETAARLSETLPSFRTKLNARNAVLGQHTEATAAAGRTKTLLRLYVTHFFQALQMAIERGGTFRAGDRTYYGLHANQETLPKLKREADLIRVADHVVRGEAKRVAEGGKALTMPSAAEIAALLGELHRLIRLRKRLAAEVDRTSAAVARRREDVADLVRDIWDEVEFASRKEAAAARRRRSREWGVIYLSRRGDEEAPGETAWEGAREEMLVA